MARIGDFSVITDSWLNTFNTNTITFGIPATIDTASATVLGFMLKTENIDDIKVTLKLNGTSIWHWNYSDGKRVQFFQEVIGAGTVVAGNNVLTIESSSDDNHLVEVSDVVLHWQANI
jgi:hypothetical protein